MLQHEFTQFSFFARLCIAVVALLFGIGLLVASLFAASQALSSEQSSPMSSRRLYFASNILPDHVLYPVFMSFDRIKLETATPEERLYLSVVYALRRYEHAVELIEKGEPQLAQGTLTKSHKYLLEAAELAREVELTPEAQLQLADLLEKQSDAVDELTQAHYSGASAHSLLELTAQARALRAQLVE